MNTPYEDMNPNEGKVSFEKEWAYFQDVREKNQLHAHWSLFEKNVKFDEKMPEDMLKFKSVINCCKTWGYHQEIPVEGETWLDLYKAASKAIELSIDIDGNQDTHTFIEGFIPLAYEIDNDVCDRGKLQGDPETTLYMYTGS